MKFFRTNTSRKYIKRIFKFSVLIFLIEVFPISSFLNTNKRIYANDLRNDQINKQIISREISDIKLIAKEISVAIVGATQGSGVLYDRKQIYHDEILRFIGYEYEIITAWHVVKDNTAGEEISLILKDGKEYIVEISDIKRIEGLDFAVIKFISRKKYKTAFELNPESSIDYSMPLFRKKKIFVAGFPLKRNKRLHISQGILVGETFYGSEGYNLFYDAPTEQGMSGGPILDENGEFIGIHGRGEKNITTSNFRGYTVKTGVNSGLSSYLIYRLDDFYKNLSPSNDKPEKDSLEAIEHYVVNAEREIRRNSGDPSSAIFYYDKAISTAERIFTDTFLENSKLSEFYLKRATLKEKKEDFKGAAKDYQYAKDLDSSRIKKIYIATLEIPFYAKINDLTKTEKLVKELRKDLINALEDIANFKDGKSSISEDFDFFKNNENALSDYEGLIVSTFHFVENVLSNISDQEKINNYTEAINLVKKLNNRNENLFILYSQRAKLREAQENYKDALLDYNYAIELNNNNTDLFLDRAKLKLKLNDIKGAIKDINNSIVINDLNIKSYLLRAEINSKYGKAEAAYNDIEKIIKLNNEKGTFKLITSDINFQLGQIYLYLKDYEAAEKEYSKVIKKRKASLLDNTPGDLGKNKRTNYLSKVKGEVINNELLLNKKLAYWGRAIARRNLNKLSDAILDYKKVLKIDPKNISALENLGDLFQQQGNYNEALEYFNKLIELVSNNARYYSKRAYQKGLLKDNKGAIEDLNKAIEIEPTNSINFYNRGLAKNNLDNYKNAIEDYSMAIELDPENASAYANRGYAKGSLGDFEGAIEDYNIAINIEKNFIGAFLNRALIKYKIDDLEGAIRDSNKVLTLEENNKYALNTRGLAKYKLGDLKSGCIDLKRASNLDFGEAIKYLKSKEGKWCNKD